MALRGRLLSFRPRGLAGWRADEFLKPSHAIISEHWFPNAVPEHDFHGFCRNIELKIRSFPIPGVSEYHARLRAEVLQLRREAPPRNPSGSRKTKWGDRNRDKRRTSVLFRAKRCRFTYLCVRQPYIARTDFYRRIYLMSGSRRAAALHGPTAGSFISSHIERPESTRCGRSN